MIVLLTPAKRFCKKLESTTTKPLFYKDSIPLQQSLKKLSLRDIQTKMKLSKPLSEVTYGYYQHLGSSLHPAVLTYDGQVYKALDYQHLAPLEKHYLQERLLILSGLYGLLKPLDGISLYRLEMQDKTLLNLYAYWNDKIVSYLKKAYQHRTIISVLSNEYEKVIEQLPHINISFSAEKPISSMELKTLRGLFVKSMALHHIQHLDELKHMTVANYAYRQDLSTASHYIYWRNV